MNIRLAKNSDGETVIQLVSDLMIELGFPEFDGRNLGKIFLGMVEGGNHGFVMLAESEETICGICTVSFVVSLRTRGVYGIVQEMYILPELRGQRIGAKMMVAALEYAQSVGCIMVEVGTPPEGSRQSKFYKRVGFKRFGDRYRYKFDIKSE
jgi:GNAT superfamily N-acetyltransferase